VEDDSRAVAVPDSAFGWLDRAPAILVGAAFVGVALAVYWLPGYDRFYNHFVLQAQAFLSGHAEIPTPQFQDVLPLVGSDGQLTGYGLLPFPPLPAIVLMPFVALWGLATNERAVSVVLGALAVGLAWWMLGFLRISRGIRLATTAFFGFGTVFWYAAQLGDTWFFAHVVAVTCLLLAVGVALGADPGADDEVEAGPGFAWLAASIEGGIRNPASVLDGRQILAGFLFGLACTARLTIVFGAPFFMLVGGGGTWLRRSVSAGIGAAIPVGLLLAYNLATTGHLMHPGYDYLYHLEAAGYPGLHYNPDWSIEDARYLPQNVAIMFGSLPALFPTHVPSSLGGGAALCADPGAVRGLFDLACPIAMPRDVGMSVILTSPAYLLVIPAFTSGRSRLVAGAFLATVAIAIVNLMHFSQGWVQFGYRFSNDFVVFALVLVATGMSRRGKLGWLGLGLVVLSIAVNLWGVAWGNLQGW
jgi:hypothetical protein